MPESSTKLSLILWVIFRRLVGKFCNSWKVRLGRAAFKVYWHFVRGTPRMPEVAGATSRVDSPQERSFLRLVDEIYRSINPPFLSYVFSSSIASSLRETAIDRSFVRLSDVCDPDTGRPLFYPLVLQIKYLEYSWRGGACRSDTRGLVLAWSKFRVLRRSLFTESSESVARVHFYNAERYLNLFCSLLIVAAITRSPRGRKNDVVFRPRLYSFLMKLS